MKEKQINSFVGGYVKFCVNKNEKSPSWQELQNKIKEEIFLCQHYQKNK